MVDNNYAMLPGSGCNLEENPFVPLPSTDVICFIFIGRVMRLKGIDKYLGAAKTIKSKYKNTEFIVAGWIEESYKRIIDENAKKGIINYIGFRKDIQDWIAKCHCTVLPSHGGEGVPNVLLESAATGRICIRSNINGTMDVIDDEVTGYILKKGSAQDLVKNIEKCFICLLKILPR